MNNSYNLVVSMNDEYTWDVGWDDEDGFIVMGRGGYSTLQEAEAAIPVIEAQLDEYYGPTSNGDRNIEVFGPVNI